MRRPASDCDSATGEREMGDAGPIAIALAAEDVLAVPPRLNDDGDDADEEAADCAGLARLAGAVPTEAEVEDERVPPGTVVPLPSNGEAGYVCGCVGGSRASRDGDADGPKPTPAMPVARRAVAGDIGMSVLH